MPESLKKILRVYFFVTAFYFLSFTAIKAEEIKTNDFTIAAAPAWVVAVEASPETLVEHASSSEGSAYLLIDQQLNAVTPESFWHVVKKITSQSGVEDQGKMQFQFDPAFEKLTIHSIRIIRDGKILDRLDAHKIKIIQQETELDRHLFNGELSAVLFLEDVRVGDELEYSYTRTGSNPILGGHFVSHFLVDWSLPMQKQYCRLVWPTSKPLTIKNHLTSIQPSVHQTGKVTEYIWELANTKAVPFEDLTPASVETMGWIQLTDFKSWNEVAQWAQALYASSSDQFPATLRQKTALWQMMSTPGEKVGAALQFVQDEVRYLGIEIGQNSHLPNSPDVVFERRFGDCKDKVNLFCSMLREMGIDSRPVLVNSVSQTAMDDWAPSPNAFNHVVAQVRLGNQVVWLDPTLMYQRGPVTNLFFPNYARGLVVDSNTTELIIIPAQRTGLPLTTINDSMRFFGYTNPVSWEIKIIKQGADADSMRRTLAQNSQDNLEKYYLNHYARFYPKIKSTLPMEIRDDTSKNEITIFLNYQIHDIWSLSDDKTKWSLAFHVDNIADLTQKPQTTLRSLPLWVNYPRHQKQITHVFLSEPCRIEEETNHIHDSAMRFSQIIRYSPKELIMGYDFLTLTNVISPADVPGHIEVLGRIIDKCGYQLMRPNGSPPLKNNPVNPLNPLNPFNLVLLFVVGAYSLLVVSVAMAYYFLRTKNSVPPLMVTDPQFTGLSGWLILLVITLFSRMVTSLVIFTRSAIGFGSHAWDSLIVPGNHGYNALWSPVLVGELLGCVTFVAWLILLIILFFQKRLAFARVFIAYGVAYCVYSLILQFCLLSIPRAASSERLSISAVVGSLIYFLIWVSYVVKSKRVKTTFVN